MKILSLVAMVIMISAQGAPFLPRRVHALVHSSRSSISPTRHGPASQISLAARPSLSAARSQWTGAELGTQTSVQAGGRGKPWINFGDGHEILPAFNGDSALTSVMESAKAEPLSLASADLDGDGIPDLLTGLQGPQGGILAVYKGNVDAIYPHSGEAHARKQNGTFSDVPFLSPARLFTIPGAPDFLETGDFDGDGYVDVAAASRGGNAIYVLPGDGNGGFDDAKSISVPGRITAMASGDVNRRDGLSDLIVAVAGEGGPELLVYEGPRGALNSTPEVIPLPAAASAISTGYLFNHTYVDIAVAAGRNLVAIHGRDRKLSSAEIDQASVTPPIVSRLSLPAPAQAVSVGRFTGSQSYQAAVLLNDGRLELAGATSSDGGSDAQELQSLETTFLTGGGAGSRPMLMKAHVSSSPGDDLVVMDQFASRLRVLVGPANGAPAAGSDGGSGWDNPIDLGVDGAPIAALPMRLNMSARNDLVVLRKGSINATVVPAQFDNVFTVTSTEDSVPGAAPSGSGASGAAVPEQSEGGTTLRDTLVEAINQAAGTNNEIIFDIPQTGVPVITLASALPSFSGTNSLTVDGFSQEQVAGVSLVSIDGNGNNGFNIPGSGNELAGLVIRNCTAAVQLTGGNNNFIEGNFVGTEADGLTPAPNNGSGVMVNGGTGNTIGGATMDAPNVIDANTGDGITVLGAVDTVILGNFVGTDAQTQMVSIPNGGNGLTVASGASAATIGSPQALNFFNFNGGDGIAISSGTNHLVQENRAQGNTGNGLELSSITSTTIGGSQNVDAGNAMWQNKLNGILIRTGATGVNIQGNDIGIGFEIDDGEEIPVLEGNIMDGISISANNNLVGGATVDLGNAIFFNGGDGVAVTSGSGNGILSNLIVPIIPNLAIHLFPGTNDGIQAPVISSATVSGASVPAATTGAQPAVVPAQSAPVMVISFEFTGQPNSMYKMQFVVPQVCGCTGADCFTDFGIYTMQVTTDSTGKAPSPLSITLSATPPADSFVNATATDPADSTSEFSECVAVGSESACEYQLSSSSGSFGASGGTGSFTVTTSASCGFTPTDPDSFIQVTSGGGLGSGTVDFTVDPNSGTTSRQSTITVAPGVTFTINQSGAGQDFSLSFASPTVTGSAGQAVPVTINVTRSGGFTGTVIITPPAKADGIKPKPATTAKVKPAKTSYTLDMKITSSAVSGTYQFIFTGTGTVAGQSVSETATLNVTVQ
ncbi:MAG TPA: FG-GAP-like repeat-containing protein [Blastocatellia bacterium]